MAATTNSVIYEYASQVTLEDSGTSAASDAYVAADDDTLESGVHNNYPLADFVLTCDFGAAVAAGSTVDLFRQDLNIDGANDAPAPSASCPHLYVGSFKIPSGASASASYPLDGIPIVADCQFSIKNSTDQNLSAGWDLKATPKTVIPAS
jgi:hypothetical protein